MKSRRSRARKAFDLAIVVGGVALVGFVAHSVWLGTTAFPIGDAKERERLSITSAVLNYSLGVAAIGGFAAMMGSGFWCMSRGEMDLTPGDD